MGQILSLELGDGFAVASGWAAREGGHGPEGRIELLLTDGTRHEAERLVPHAGLAQRGICSEPCAFVLDFPCDRAVLAGPIELLVGGQPVSSHRFELNELKPFQPLGQLEEAGTSRLKGWAYHPALWTAGTASPPVEFVVDDSIRFPIELNRTRADLSFSGGGARNPLGFELGDTDIVRLFSRARQTRRLLEGRRDYALVVGGNTVARMTVGEEASTPAAAPAEPLGFVDFFGHAPDLGGWVLGGWMRTAELERSHECQGQLRFDGTVIEGRALVEWHDREDVREFGIGFVAFVPGEHVPQPPLLQDATFDLGRPRLLQPSAMARSMPQAEVIRAAQHQLGRNGQGGHGLSALLQQPTFEGHDTLAALPSPIHLEVDSLVACPGTGAALMGWLVDPNRAVAGIRLRVPGGASPSLLGHWLWHERRDILDAFGPRYGLEDPSLGFLAYAPLGVESMAGAYLELRLHDGSVGFKPLPPPAPSSVGTLRRFLGNASVASDAISATFGKVLAPAALAMNRARLAQKAEPSIVEIGPLPEAPRASIIVPLYGRMDWVLHQCAHFSAHGLDGCELVYVLDDPPRKDELVSLAHSCWRRFGLPMRLVLLPRNLGFAPANNVGLRHARGRYVCFLNSDVLPQAEGWLDLMIGALEKDATLGAVGAVLTFEDGTLQHGGMVMQRLTQLANLPFPMHPGKGRQMPAPQGIRRVEAITGACMVMARSLAEELGGFDEDYIIGDFEDVDLCFRIQRKGLGTAVHDGVVMWHLERQSQGAPGVSWRHNVTMVNAMTFASRWDHMTPGARQEPGAVVRLS